MQETASLLACLAQSSMAGYCKEKHVTAEQFELGSWACRYCNLNSHLNSHVSVQWAVVVLSGVQGNVSLKMLRVLKLPGTQGRNAIRFHILLCSNYKQLQTVDFRFCAYLL